MCQDPNRGARDQAKFQNELTMYKWGNEKNMWRNKEVQFLKGNDAAVIGYSRAKSDALEGAFKVASKARAAKESAFADYSQRNRKGTAAGYLSGQAGSKAAGRNAYLALLNKYSNAEYAVEESITRGTDKAQLIAKRGYISRRNQLIGKLGIPKAPPMLQPIPGKDKMGQFMNFVSTASSIAGMFHPAGAIMAGLTKPKPGPGPTPTDPDSI